MAYNLTAKQTAKPYVVMKCPSCGREMTFDVMPNKNDNGVHKEYWCRDCNNIARVRVIYGKGSNAFM